jgi:hypothetical protein
LLDASARLRNTVGHLQDPVPIVDRDDRLADPFRLIMTAGLERAVVNELPDDAPRGGPWDSVPRRRRSDPSFSFVRRRQLSTKGR